MNRLALIAGIAGSAAVASADFDLQITEIWMGNIPGNNLTEDWFEVTNFGDTAWTIAAGNLFYDDDSADAGTADLISGVTLINPGESVIFVNGNAGGALGWLDIWGDQVSENLQIGFFNGAGLGQGGDAVTLFLSADGTVTTADIIDFEAFPNGNNFGGQSYDVVAAQYSFLGDLAGSFATSTLNNQGQPAIGNPGSVVPAPAAALVLGLGGLAAGRRRR